MGAYFSIHIHSFHLICVLHCISTSTPYVRYAFSFIFHTSLMFIFSVMHLTCDLHFHFIFHSIFYLCIPCVIYIILIVSYICNYFMHFYISAPCSPYDLIYIMYMHTYFSFIFHLHTQAQFFTA